jgi:hypothetical protein
MGTQMKLLHVPDVARSQIQEIATGAGSFEKIGEKNARCRIR